MIKEIVLFVMWMFNMMWFYFSREIPTRVEALILINLIIISLIIGSQNAKKGTTPNEKI